MNKSYEVECTKKYAIIVNGKKIRYSDYEKLDYGYAKVKKHGKWGILDRNGKTVIKPKYDNIVQCGMGSFELAIGEKCWTYLTTVGTILPM